MLFFTNMVVKGNTPVSERWWSIKIPSHLYKEIDKTISAITIHGIREYDSVPDFIRQACVQLLQKEEVRKNRMLTAEAKV